MKAACEERNAILQIFRMNGAILLFELGPIYKLNLSKLVITLRHKCIAQRISKVERHELRHMLNWMSEQGKSPSILL